VIFVQRPRKNFEWLISPIKLDSLGSTCSYHIGYFAGHQIIII